MENTTKSHVSSPELICVKLESGDEALFVNGDTVYTQDPSDRGWAPKVIADRLAPALGTSFQEVSMPTPAEDEWCWGDVFKLIKQMSRQGLHLIGCGIRFYKVGTNWRWIQSDDETGETSKGPFETLAAAETDAWRQAASGVMGDKNLSDQAWEQLGEQAQMRLIAVHLQTYPI